MKTIDLNFELKDLDGNVLQGIPSAGKFVGNLLVTETDGDAIKFFDWAISLNKNEVISVDNADFTLIKELIKKSEKVTILAKAQILKYLETIK